MHRKDFLKMGGLGLAAINLPNWPIGPATKPIVISTWDSGMPVNAAAWKLLSANGKSVDAVEAGARYIEDTINCCVGIGGYPDRNGIVTLDACIMDEHANCGAVAGVERIKHPISLARRVMESTPHVMLVGHGAQEFALQNGFTLESADLSADAKDAYNKWLEKTQYKPVINIEKKKDNGPFAPHFFDDGSVNHDTMGLVAMDSAGDLSGAVTTSGMAFKIHGRVGDSPIIGAGLFVDNEIGAATSSGLGEEVIRICGTHTVVEYMRHGYSPEDACKKACERIVNRDREKAKTLQVGFLALNKNGEYGAYAIQKGFVISVTSESENQIHEAKFLL
jgi:N4-(beta-N-acetylglucosaminyl)-L-asparaginase